MSIQYDEKSNRYIDTDMDAEYFEENSCSYCGEIIHGDEELCKECEAREVFANKFG